MFEFFDLIGSIIHTAITLFNHSISILVSFFRMTTSGLAYASTAYSFLPVFLKAFVGAFVGYTIVINILHKGG